MPVVRDVDVEGVGGRVDDGQPVDPRRWAQGQSPDDEDDEGGGDHNHVDERPAPEDGPPGGDGGAESGLGVHAGRPARQPSSGSSWASPSGGGAGRSDRPASSASLTSRGSPSSGGGSNSGRA